ncbi:FUSC family protein [Micromonospora kangleipakensis]|nr:FUSC family protein [Micromonospora kangleipakensis]
MAGKRDKPRRVDIDGVAIAAWPERVGEALRQVRQRARPTIRDRWHRVRFSFTVILQVGLAATLSWFIAAELLQVSQPVFAPIAALSTLFSSIGQRFRRTVELIAGTVLGIGIGDGLIILIGKGSWQVGLIVILSMGIAIFVGGSPSVVSNAAATGILLATLGGTEGNIQFRVIEAVIGGATALLVSTVLLPFNPLRVVNRAARPALNRLADELTQTAEALEKRDAGCAQRTLDRLHEVETFMGELEKALEGGRETATLSPVRWRRRGALTQYVESAEYLDHAVANSGTLVRRAVTLIEDEEPTPASLPSAVRELAESIRRLLQELGRGADPAGCRECALNAVADAGQAYADGVGFSGSVVVAQVRTTASDLLRASGIERGEAYQMVRQAVTRKAGERAEGAMP